MFKDIIPTFIASSAIFARVYTWIEEITLDGIFISLTGIAGFIYLLMKIYDQYIITKNRKKKEDEP